MSHSMNFNKFYLLAIFSIILEPLEYTRILGEPKIFIILAVLIVIWYKQNLQTYCWSNYFKTHLLKRIFCLIKQLFHDLQLHDLHDQQIKSLKLMHSNIRISFIKGRHPVIPSNFYIQKRKTKIVKYISQLYMSSSQKLNFGSPSCSKKEPEV